MTDTRIDFELRNRIAKQCQENTVHLWNEHAPQQELVRNEDGEECFVDDTPFGEGPQWKPTQAVADLTALGGGRARRQTVRV